MESWLEEQAGMQAREWSTAVERFYPDAASTWADPDEHMQLLSRYFLPAVEEFGWDAVLSGRGNRVLDLGAGTGWLSAFISRRDDVRSIDALDSDERNLREMLPAMVERLHGHASKIRPVLAVFEPLPLGDDSYDLILASSSIHHAPSLSRAMRELARVLAPGGNIVLLNELPRSREGYFRYAVHLFGIALARIAGGEFDEMDEWISSAGLAYDPRLGDIAYADYHYEAAASRAGLSCSKIPSSPAVPPLREGLRLTHFLLRHDTSAAPAPVRPLAQCDEMLLSRLREAIPGDIMEPTWNGPERSKEGTELDAALAPQLTEMQSDLDEARRRLAETHAALDTMATSRSWRMTRWFRRTR